MALRDRPLFTEVHDRIEHFTPVPQSVYVHAKSHEERSTHVDKWGAKSRLNFVSISDQSDNSISYVGRHGSDQTVLLRSDNQIAAIWQEYPDVDIYLDITGLAHHVWAPLLRSALTTGRTVKAVYVEPLEYRFSANPTEGAIFDLSERISGIRPIPGFASLAPSDEDRTCFVPLLGFEGAGIPAGVPVLCISRESASIARQSGLEECPVRYRELSFQPFLRTRGHRSDEPC